MRKQFNKILELYQTSSGQLINLDKSEMSFIRNVHEEKKLLFQGWMLIKAVENHLKYLGLPAVVGRSKQQVFNFLQEKVWKKLKGWKGNFMSYAAREILIKSVVQAIPMYIMSCFKLPDSLCDQIERMICKFWWGSKQGERKVHWISWNKLCEEKKEGGMGLRTLREFNLAMLAKQGWRILQNEDSLLSICLKGRYFPRSFFLQASVGYCPSYTWRSIIQARRAVIDHVGMWRIGDGHNIRIWGDNWLPYQNGHKVWSAEPPNNVAEFVSDLMNDENDGWNLQLVNDLFLPFETQQITQIPILSNHRDKFVWWENKNGEFTVKSAYCFLKQKKVVQQSNQSLLPQHRKVWSRLWKIRTVPRHAHMIWRLLHARLPVKMVLFNKGINCSPQCCFCDNHIETIEHLFMECEWVQSVWFVSPLGIKFSSTTAPAKSNHEAT